MNLKPKKGLKVRRNRPARLKLCDLTPEDALATYDLLALRAGVAGIGAFRKIKPDTALVYLFAYKKRWPDGYKLLTSSLYTIYSDILHNN